MSKIKENPEVSETVENSAVEAIAPVVGEETPLEQEVTAVTAEPTEEVAAIVAEPVAAEISEVVEEPVAAEVNAVVGEPVVEVVADLVEAPVAEEVVAAVETPETEAADEVAASVVVETPARKEKPVLVETAVASANEEEFDWDAFEGKKGRTVGIFFQTIYDRDVRQYTLNILQEKECVDGIVISMNKREVVVNIGYKSDGIVSVNEFRYNPNLKIGDKVEVYVETLEDKKGQLTIIPQKKLALCVVGIASMLLLKMMKLLPDSSNAVQKAV